MYTIYDGYTFGWIQLVIIEKEKGEFIGRGEIGSKVGVRAIAFPVVH